MRSVSTNSESSPGFPSSEGSRDAAESSSSAASGESEVEIASPAHKRVKVRHQVHQRLPDRFDRHPSPPRYQGQPAVIQQLPTQQNQVPIPNLRNPPQVPAMTPVADAGITVADDIPRQPPYYNDLKLESRMYRGEGYECFPVALGTVDGHQDKCDEWDAITAVENQRADLGLPPSYQQIPDNEALDDEAADILVNVLEVLPDIEHKFALKKIRERLNQLNNYANYTLAAEDVLSHILEAKSYPRERGEDSKKDKQEMAVDETGMTIVWDKTLVQDGSYLKEAVVLLAGQFPHVPTHHIFRVVHEKHSIFESYIQINNTDNKYYTLTPRSRQYHRHRNPRTALEKKYVYRTHREQRDLDKFPHMVNELQAAKQHIARESLKLEKQKEQETTEAENLEAHKESGDIVECQCCFDDETPINRAVTCQGDDIHFFCFGCVNQLANTQIGFMKYEMVCMDGGGCKAQLSIDGIGQAVPMKTFDRLAFNQQQAEIAAAGIEGLEQCPFCDFKGICGSIEQERVFNCQNPDCFRATCRLCKENAHVPKTCEEAKVDKGLSARHIVEEARTEAMVRTCPKCKVKIIKELGCNKMICNQCQCIICYVCKADISNGKEGGYEHFNKAGGKCNLYDKAGRDMHEEEADAAEEEAIKQAKAEDAELDENQLRIETGKNGKKKKAKSQNHRAGPIPQPPPLQAAFALGPLEAFLNHPPLVRDHLDNPTRPNLQNLGQQVRDLEHRGDQIAREIQGVRRHGLADALRDQARADFALRLQPGQIHQYRDGAVRQQRLVAEDALQHQNERAFQAAQQQQEALRAAQQAAAIRPPGYPGFILPAIQAAAPLGMYAQPNMANHWALPPGAQLQVPQAAPMIDVDDGFRGFDDDDFGELQHLFGGPNINNNWPDMLQYPQNNYPNGMN